MVTRNRVQGETLFIAVLPPAFEQFNVFGVFKGPSGSALNVAGVKTACVIGDPWFVDGQGWTDYGPVPPLRSIWTLTADTNTWALGQWGGEIWVVDGRGNKNVQTRVSFQIVASLSTGGSNDVRSQAQQAVENIEAYLGNPANFSAASYKINNRELTRYSIGELRQLLGYWKTKVREENIRASGRRGIIGRRISVVF